MSQVWNKIDTNLIAWNIKTWTSIYWVTWTFSWWISLTWREDVNSSSITIGSLTLRYKQIWNLYFLSWLTAGSSIYNIWWNTLTIVWDTANELASVLGWTLKGYINTNQLAISSWHAYWNWSSWQTANSTYYTITAIELN